MSDAIKIAVAAWAPQSGWHADEICGQAEQAEALGFHSFWLPENHFGDQRAIPSPLTLLAAVAARTRRIGLGTTSYLLPIRHPLQAAEEVAVLDQLSGGRVILGVGRGIQDTVFRAFGVPQRDKRQRFGENLQLMLRAWSGENVVEDDGQPVRLAPLPLQRPHPPVWVAAFGPLALQQVASLGLPYLASPMESLSLLQQNYRRYRDIQRECGQTPVATVPVMRTVFVSDQVSEVQRVRDSLARSAPSLPGGDTLEVGDWAVVGDSHYARDKLMEYTEGLGITHLIIGGRLPQLPRDTLLASHQAVLDISATA